MSGSPLEQFNIIKIFSLPSIAGFDLDFTNASLYMLLSVLSASLFLCLGVRKLSVIPNLYQAFVESIYAFVRNIVKDNAGDEGLEYYPLIFTIFIFICFCNLFGMLPLPFKFTVTSHIIVTFAISVFVCVWLTIIGFNKRKAGFLKLFLPDGTPLWLSPMMIAIEIFAYFSRPVSLSIRLAANMVAGHTILEVIADFVVSIGSFFSVVPFLFVSMLIAFEIFIAILQAYIFTVLVCVYLNDSLHEH